MTEEKKLTMMLVACFGLALVLVIGILRHWRESLPSAKIDQNTQELIEENCRINPNYHSTCKK